jgi:hypothetical protein
MFVGAGAYRSRMRSDIDETWVDRLVKSTDLADERSADADRLWLDLKRWAVGFAARRTDVESAVLTWPARGLLADEARSFRRAVDQGIAVVDDAGYVSLPTVRPKKPAGRYALLSKSGHGVSVNLEYLVQIGATAELILDHGWAPAAVDFERGEFDALVVNGGRVAVAMEAKARVAGTDGLEKLVKSWLRLLDGRDQVWASNAGLKLRELESLSRECPVLVWLVADGARWSVWAHSTESGLSLSPGQPPTRPLARNPGQNEEQAWKFRPFDPTWHNARTAARGGACSCVKGQ